MVIGTTTIGTMATVATTTAAATTVAMATATTVAHRPLGHLLLQVTLMR